MGSARCHSAGTIQCLSSCGVPEGRNCCHCFCSSAGSMAGWKRLRSQSTSQAMAVSTWPWPCGSSSCGVLAVLGGPWLWHLPSHPPKKDCALFFFLLKYVTTETLPSSLNGPATCPLSEPSKTGSVGHSRSFRQLSLSEAASVVSSAPTKRQHTRSE